MRLIALVLAALHFCSPARADVGPLPNLNLIGAQYGFPPGAVSADLEEFLTDNGMTVVRYDPKRGIEDSRRLSLLHARMVERYGQVNPGCEHNYAWANQWSLATGFRVARRYTLTWVACDGRVAAIVGDYDARLVLK